MRIDVDDLTRPEVQDLLAEHLAEMHASSPACSVHALPLDALRAPGVTVWSAWDEAELLGAGALTELDAAHGEIKSMRTATAHRGRGVAEAILGRIVAEARARGYSRVSLETGSGEVFAPARRLYGRAGFVECPPFADYTLDPESTFLTLPLT